ASGFTVGDREAELYDIALADFELEAGKHRLEVQPALGDVALLDLDTWMVIERGHDRPDQLVVVKRTILARQHGPGLAPKRTDQLALLSLRQPAIDIGRHQTRRVLLHLAVIGQGNARDLR